MAADLVQKELYRSDLDIIFTFMLEKACERPFVGLGPSLFIRSARLSHKPSGLELLLQHAGRRAKILTAKQMEQLARTAQSRSYGAWFVYLNIILYNYII